MSILVMALRFMGTVWLWAAGLLIVSSHLVVLHLDGFWALVSLLNPWNIASMLTLDLTAAPGLLLLMAADQLTTTATCLRTDRPLSHPVHSAPIDGARLRSNWSTVWAISADETPTIPIAARPAQLPELL